MGFNKVSCFGVRVSGFRIHVCVFWDCVFVFWRMKFRGLVGVAMRGSGSELSA